MVLCLEIHKLKFIGSLHINKGIKMKDTFLHIIVATTMTHT